MPGYSSAPTLGATPANTLGSPLALPPVAPVVQLGSGRTGTELKRATTAVGTFIGIMSLLSPESQQSRAKYFELFFETKQGTQKKTIFFNERSTIGDIVRQECERRDIIFEATTIQVSFEVYPFCFSPN